MSDTMTVESRGDVHFLVLSSVEAVSRIDSRTRIILQSGADIWFEETEPYFSICTALRAFHGSACTSSSAPKAQ